MIVKRRDGMSCVSFYRRNAPTASSGSPAVGEAGSGLGFRRVAREQAGPEAGGSAADRRPIEGLSRVSRHPPPSERPRDAATTLPQFAFHGHPAPVPHPPAA